MTGRAGQLAIHAVIVSLGSGTATGASTNHHCRSNRLSLFIIIVITVPLSSITSYTLASPFHPFRYPVQRSLTPPLPSSTPGGNDGDDDGACLAYASAPDASSS